MVQAVFIALLSGSIAALLSGALIPGAAPFLMFFLIAPLPLMVAGLMSHWLVAVLAALFGVLLVNFNTGSQAALGFLAMVGLPGAALTMLHTHFFSASPARPTGDGVILGKIFLLVCGYVALLITGAALLVQPDYPLMVASLRDSIEKLGGLVFGADLATLPKGADGKPGSGLFDLMAAIMLPSSAILLIIMLVVSATLALAITDRLGTLVPARPDLRRFRLPGGALILFGLALIIGLREGYVGLFAELVLIGVAFGFVLQGLAVMHTRLIGTVGRGWLIGASWALVIIFGFPAVIFLILGMLDHLLNFRQRHP